MGLPLAGQELKCGDMFSRTNPINLFLDDHLLPDSLTLILQTYSASLTSACPESEQSCGRPRPTHSSSLFLLPQCLSLTLPVSDSSDILASLVPNGSSAPSLILGMFTWGQRAVTK